MRLNVTITGVGAVVESEVQKEMIKAYKVPDIPSHQFDQTCSPYFIRASRTPDSDQSSYSIKAACSQDLPARALKYVQLSDEERERWRNFRGPAFPCTTLAPSAPLPTSTPPPATREWMADAVPPPSSSLEGGLAEAASRCLAPHVFEKLQHAEVSCERLESEVNSLKQQLLLRETEVEGLTKSLQQTILRLKAVSEVTTREREKQRKEEKRHESLEEAPRPVVTPQAVVFLPAAGSGSSLSAELQREAELAAWKNREKRQQLQDMSDALALQQRLMREQIEIASAAMSRADRAEAELAAYKRRSSADMMSIPGSFSRTANDGPNVYNF
ncbi:MAG: hypothetical protein SGPRY_007520 [Prymnesium sp.]